MADKNSSQIQTEIDHRKPCTRCGKLCDVRVRCQVDETGTWHLVCPGKCWKGVSGGVVDGKTLPDSNQSAINTRRYSSLTRAEEFPSCTGTSSDETSGDKTEEHKHYKYGGMWKNKHEAVSAKKPRKKLKVKQSQ